MKHLHGKAGYVLALLLYVPSAAHACTVGTNSVSVSNGLSFGGIFSGVGGTITISPEGIRSNNGAIPVTLNSAPAANPATLEICSTSDTSAFITLPGDATIFLHDGAGHSMAVNSFTSSSPLGLAVSSSGTDSLSVGATLTVASNQASGNYSGTFQVTVTYQ